jgi:hypothetical protein
MKNNTIKFYVCNEAFGCVYHSKKSWWENYKNLWGHKILGNGKCESIQISRADYDKFCIFITATGKIGSNETYQMDATRVKHFFGDYWTLSNFAVCEFGPKQKISEIVASDDCTGRERWDDCTGRERWDYCV